MPTKGLSSHMAMRGQEGAGCAAGSPVAVRRRTWVLPEALGRRRITFCWGAHKL